MIDAKQAVQIAKKEAADLLGSASSSLEEIERDSYKDREIWSITLSLSRSLNLMAPIAQLSADPREYKRFLIDVETGELVAMKVREFAQQ
jgi:DNA-binding XRE family transcriptional regulator